MNLSMKWLKDYVDLDISAEELAERLTKCGFEVEGIIKSGEEFGKVITGKITEITSHPNATTLKVCKVDVKSEILQILTNAKNVFEGAIVPVAIDGADLPCGVHITKTKMRGVDSDGMFCGSEEIAIDNSIYPGAENGGVMIFADGTEIGCSVAKIFGFDDAILQINVLSNRPDCDSVLGLAREVSAVTGAKFTSPKFNYKSNVSDKVEVSIETDDCHRYMSAIVRDVKIEASPKWIQDRLRSVGIRSINNIVDITNFVLVEIGQPMHAFDMQDIEDSHIIIRNSQAGEKVVALDEKEYTLSEGDIIIADENKILAIAGVMGGLGTGIKETSRNIIFESASFKRGKIRQLSRRIGLRTDSSARFERGVEPSICELGIRRALSLIEELGAGRISSEIVDVYPNPKESKIIKANSIDINTLLGIDASKEEMKSILDKLYITTEIVGEDLICNIPNYRSDIDGIADIAEEIIRIYGFDKIKTTFMQKCSYKPTVINKEMSSIRKIKDIASIVGYNELCSYSFISLKDFDKLNIDKENELRNTFEISNPMNEDMTYMRTIMLPNMLKSIEYNEKHSFRNIKAFEVGRVYKKVEGQILANEIPTLIMAVSGNADFFALKGAVEEILCAVNINIDIEPETTEPFLNKNKSGRVMYNGRNIGFIGDLHPTILANYEINESVLVAEISLEGILESDREFGAFDMPSKSQIVVRDFTFLVPSNISYANLFKELKQSSGKTCKNIELVDLYEGEQVASGFKSMSFKFEYQKEDGTFTSDEIENMVQRMLRALQYKLNVKLRDIELIVQE